MEKKKKKKKNKLEYFSTDKMYLVDKISKKVKLQIVFYISLVLSMVMLAFGLLFLSSSITINGKKVNVSYNEKGNTDYTVYLKDNSFYDSNYLGSGMKYVASLIKTINTEFHYEVHSDKNLDYKYKYKITGKLQILDKDDPSKVLFEKDEVLKDEVLKDVNSNNFVINEDLNIDYNKYNNYVNAYKSAYGLIVNSRLVLTMDVAVDGIYDEMSEKLSKNNQLKITIPLSEQTIDITVDSNNINNSDSLSSAEGNVINNLFIFISGSLFTIVSILGFILSRKIYTTYRNKNIYNITVNKLLKEYDRLIVTGTIDIVEKEFKHKMHPSNFIEMVDAAENLGAPILYYEVIPNEKCFFVIVKGDTLYKYRLTRAYLEKEQRKKSELNEETSKK